MKKLRTLKDAKLENKRVLVRLDLNVPLDENGNITDDTRIKRALPTLKYLLGKRTKLILITHLGRPNGKKSKKLKLDIVANHVAKLMRKPVKKLNECVGKKVEEEINKMRQGQIIMLENIRFYPEEEKNNMVFARKLAKLGDIFVSDGFGVAHRAHASTVGIAKILPSFAGLLMEQEIAMLSPLVQKKAKKPVTLIMGGAKIDDKIGVLKNFIGKADYFLIGGGLANTFLFAEGYAVGKSLFQKDKKSVAQDILLTCEKKKEKFYIPEDVIVADEISDTEKTLDLPVKDIEGKMRVLDIGSKTIEKYVSIIKKSKTIIWNGPVGLSEYKPFQRGTLEIAKAIAETKATTIIGGGDTIEAIKRLGLKEKQFTHISTGGGASLEFLEGKSLPGIEVLLKR